MTGVVYSTKTDLIVTCAMDSEGECASHVFIVMNATTYDYKYTRCIVQS